MNKKAVSGHGAVAWDSQLVLVLVLVLLGTVLFEALFPTGTVWLGGPPGEFSQLSWGPPGFACWSDGDPGNPCSWAQFPGAAAARSYVGVTWRPSLP